MMRKLVLVPISLLLFLAIVVAWTLAHSAKAAPVGLPEVTEDWKMTAVTSAVAAGYVDGYPQGTFQRDRRVSRSLFTRVPVITLK